jgi:hypothetical protein
MAGQYLIVSRSGTNPLTVAVQNAIEDGYVPIGGVSAHTETRGRESITTYHQALYKPE